MRELEIQTVGDSVALLLDEETLKIIGAGIGDTVFSVESKQGMRLIPKKSEVGKQIASANEVMER